MIPIEYQLCTKWRCEQAKNTVGIAHELASESLEVIHIVNYVKQVVWNNWSNLCDLKLNLGEN